MCVVCSELLLLWRGREEQNGIINEKSINIAMASALKTIDKIGKRVLH